MLNSLISLYKKNSSFSFVSCYLKKSCMFCDKFSLKIHYLTSSKYLQMISYFLFVLVRSARFHKFNGTFSSFGSEFTLCDIIC